MTHVPTARPPGLPEPLHPGAAPRRSVRRVWLLRITCLALLAAGSACGTTGDMALGPDQLPIRASATTAADRLRLGMLPRALGRPHLRVRPLELLARRYRRGRVRSHGLAGGRPALGRPAEGPAEARARQDWELYVDLEGGAEVSLSYRPPGGLALPVQAGDMIYVRAWRRSAGAGSGEEPRLTDMSPEATSAPASQARDAAGRVDERIGLVLRWDDGRLAGAIVDGLLLPEGTLEEGLRVSPSQDVAYVEVRALASGCRATVDHREVEVRSDRGRRALAPGEWAEVRHGPESLRVAILEAAIASPDDTCGRETPRTFAYAVMATRRPAPASPAGVAAEP